MKLEHNWVEVIVAKANLIVRSVVGTLGRVRIVIIHDMLPLLIIVERANGMDQLLVPHLNVKARLNNHNLIQLQIRNKTLAQCPYFRV